jgi:ferredoxin-NADP reductase
VAVVGATRHETDDVRTLQLDVDGWPGHLAGQHVDVRLTAEDGYSTQRSYSIASAASAGTVEITVERVADGEVSPYLVDIAEPGDRCEVRGPVGGYFTWEPAQTRPVLLVAGGSGVVPLMSMIRTRAVAGSRVPFRLVYSARSPAAVIYRDELRARERDDHGLDVTYAYTRDVPQGWPRPPGRVDASLLAAAGWPTDAQPACFVCGPTGFVEVVAGLLLDLGYAAECVRTERFGPTGGRP